MYKEIKVKVKRIFHELRNEAAEESSQHDKSSCNSFIFRSFSVFWKAVRKEGISWRISRIGTVKIALERSLSSARGNGNANKEITPV